MKRILIVGAGEFGREIQRLIERINQIHQRWQIEGYLDDGIERGTEINGYQVKGGLDDLKEFEDSVSVVCAVGVAKVREKVICKVKEMGKFEFPNLIDPDVQMPKNISLGEGNIICAGSFLAENIKIKNFTIINMSCTLGHGVILDSFVTIHEGVCISGYGEIKKGVELEMGSKITQGKIVGENTTVGIGTVVERDIPSDCVIKGVPAKIVKMYGGGYKNLLIVGASGHGKVIADLARQIGYYSNIYFLDDDVQLQNVDESIIGTSDYAIGHKNEYDVVIAVGNSQIRERIHKKYDEAGVSIVSLIHPSAILAEKGITIGKGTVVMAGAVIQQGTKLGNGVIVNTASSIDHECHIGDFAHIAVGSHLAGNVKLGDGTWIGAGAVVNNNVNICENTLIGAGAVVLKDITDSGTYVGVPARKIA